MSTEWIDSNIGSRKPVRTHHPFLTISVFSFDYACFEGKRHGVRYFIAPDVSLETLADPASSLGIGILSGHRAMDHADGFRGQNRLFDAILAQSKILDLPYEDQCSPKYYFDLVRTLRDFHGEFDRVVEVGVFMGGSSSVFAGCISPFDFDLDMIDINLPYLRFAYERVRRLYPDAAKRIRLFHGDLPSYVRTVLSEADGGKYVIHHDGAHHFDQVVRDMASLSFIGERLHAIIAQDTHLRGAIHHMNFVDMAIYAVFGLDLKYAAIGNKYGALDARTRPNIYEGNYFMPDASEGVVLPMAVNQFKYPHPRLNIDDFLPAITIPQIVLDAA